MAGLCAIAALTGTRRPRWITIATAWVSSGFLFVWSAWKLPLTAYLSTGGDGKTVWPENLAILTTQEAIGIATGLAMFSVVLTAARSTGRLKTTKLHSGP